MCVYMCMYNDGSLFKPATGEEVIPTKWPMVSGGVLSMSPTHTTSAVTSSAVMSPALQTITVDSSQKSILSGDKPITPTSAVPCSVSPLTGLIQQTAKLGTTLTNDLKPVFLPSGIIVDHSAQVLSNGTGAVFKPVEITTNSFSTPVITTNSAAILNCCSEKSHIPQLGELPVSYAVPVFTKGLKKLPTKGALKEYPELNVPFPKVKSEFSKAIDRKESWDMQQKMEADTKTCIYQVGLD